MNKFIIFFGFLLAHLISLCQGYSYKIFTADDGLNERQINQIFQDSYGNLWTSHIAGLTKYDGLNFSQHLFKNEVQSFRFENENNLIETPERKIFFIGGLNLYDLNGKLEGQKIDSQLVFKLQGGRVLGSSFNALDRNGHRLFSADRTKPKGTVSDSVFYQLGSKIFFIRVKGAQNRTISKISFDREILRDENQYSGFLIKDNNKNVYLRIADTLKLTNNFYKFDKGKLQKVAESAYQNNRSKIVQTKNGCIWILCNIKNSLIAECYDANQKLVKRHIFSDFFDPKEKGNSSYSAVLPDSKDNIWFSWRKGLVKVNLEGFESFEDNKRSVITQQSVTMDEFGNLGFISYENFSNYINAFAIDKFDNVISGERIFDGREFSFICDDEKFIQLFNKINHQDIACCFIDRENIIWLGTFSGLIKLSPIPFKRRDLRLSDNEPEYILQVRDKLNRAYYVKEDRKKKTYFLRVYDGQKLIKTKDFKCGDESMFMGIKLTPFCNGVNFLYENSKGHEVLGFLDGKFENEFPAQEAGELSLLYRTEHEILFTFQSSEPSTRRIFKVTEKEITPLFVPDSILNIFFKREKESTSSIVKNWSFIINDELKAYKFRGDNTFERTELPGLPNKSLPKMNEYRFYYDGKEGTSYYIDLKGTFLRIKKDTVTAIKCLNWDSISNQNDLKAYFSENIKEPAMMDYSEADTKFIVHLRDLLIFCAKNELVIFKMLNPTETKFVRQIKYSDIKGFENFSSFSYFAENDYLAMWSLSECKIVSYGEILSGEIKGLIHYPFHNIDGLWDVRSFSPFEEQKGTVVSYLGIRGFNTAAPILSNFELTYIDEDGHIQLHELSAGNKLRVNYFNSKLFIDYKAICLMDGFKVRYKSKLLGYDKEWNETDKRGSEYSSLSPGNYTFQVYASNNEGVWTINPSTFLLDIDPPWYRTWLAYFLYALLVLGSFFLIMKARIRLLESEKAKLEETVAARTWQITAQKQVIEEKHREITDSINYAERIQRSFLATTELLNENLKEYFVFFQPKDVVSGDFYWAAKLSNGNFALMTADSTGHGVPGAIMSILNITCVEKAVEEEELLQPSKILNHTRDNIIKRLQRDGSIGGGKDGMDAILICFDFKKSQLTYAAAHNPLWIVRKGQLLEYEPDKMPVGKHDKDSVSFTQHTVTLHKGDVVYSLTDGMADQFGGPNGKKFMYKRLKELLVGNADKPMDEQKNALMTALNDWKGDLEQVDDVCVIGVRV